MGGVHCTALAYTCLPRPKQSRRTAWPPLWPRRVRTDRPRDPIIEPVPTVHLTDAAINSGTQPNSKPEPAWITGASPVVLCHARLFCLRAILFEESASSSRRCREFLLSAGFHANLPLCAKCVAQQNRCVPCVHGAISVAFSGSVRALKSRHSYFNAGTVFSSCQVFSVRHLVASANLRQRRSSSYGNARDFFRRNSFCLR